MEKHKLNIYPEMQPDEFNELKEKIALGFDAKQPIYLYQGKILDGWNRFRACSETGITPIYKEFVGSDTDAINYVIQSNVRRNLNSGQRAAIAVEADEIIEAIREQVEKDRREKQAETKTGMQYNQNLSDKKLSNKNEHETKTATKIATTFGTNRTYVNEASKLKKSNPIAFEQVKSGVKTISDIKKEEKKVIRQQEIEATKQKIEQENTILTDKFDVIVIDPPWAYEERGGVKNDAYDPDQNRSAVPYPTMTVNEIKDLELPDKDNCVLWLWTTHAFLRDAFDLLDAWGYTYKATVVWDKEIIGMGRNLRMQCEFCLLATKGKPTLLNKESERDIIREKRREHSRKPEEFYNKVERMTIGKRIDYFSRQKRENWYHYGAETGKF